VGSAFTVFFCAGPIADFAAAKTADSKVYADFFHGMLERGFYLPPAQLEAAFISLAHTDAEIDSFLAAAEETLAAIRVLR
jgi:glutamate-1-semialdehyde 2,1-aminomutase